MAGDAITYDVYRGSLASIATGSYDHSRVPGGCDFAGGSLDFADLGDGVDAYYLVAATNGAVEGTLGRRSSGAARPPADSPCP